jgi:hypothetical protein
MVKREFQRLVRIVAHMPVGVSVPRDYIQPLAQLKPVEPAVMVHKIGRYGYIGVYRPHRVDFHLHKIDGLVGTEPVPVNFQPVDGIFPSADGRVYLAPARILMAPKRRPPFFVQVVKRHVLRLQPPAERFLAQWAVTKPAIFV